MRKATRKQLAGAIADLLDKGLSADKIATEVAAYLLAERRTGELAPLMRDVMELRAQRGTIEATATSAFPLETSVKEAIKRLAKQPYPAAKHVVLNETRDPALIGGVIINTGERNLDITIHDRLKHLTQLLNAS